LKKSQDLEIYEMDYTTNKNLQEVCELKQPILFHYSNVNPDFFEDMTTDTLSKQDSYDVKVKDSTEYWKENDTNADYVILPFKSASNLIKSDTASKYFIENNDDFIQEAGFSTLFEENDNFIKPHYVINKKYDILMGSVNTVTPLRYHTNSRQFFIVNSGKIVVKMTPWKSSKYLHLHKDYENYEFRSPIHVWSPQEEYKTDMEKLKFLEFQVHPGYALYVPPFWWYSIKFIGNSENLVTGTTYTTIMNSITNIPNYFLYFIQQTNIQKKVTRTLRIGEDQQEEKEKEGENEPITTTETTSI
jgi:mannose-6-phosphate isomerase-like protein (cupin superfamily)